MSAPGGISQKAQMKYEYKRVSPNTNVSSKWKKVGDTDLGHVDIGIQEVNVWT